MRGAPEKGEDHGGGNTMARRDQAASTVFEKGADDGTVEALAVLGSIVGALAEG